MPFLNTLIEPAIKRKKKKKKMSATAFLEGQLNENPDLFEHMQKFGELYDRRWGEETKKKKKWKKVLSLFFLNCIIVLIIFY